MIRRVSGVILPFSLLSLASFVGACGSEIAVVGGECLPGFVQTGGECVRRVLVTPTDPPAPPPDDRTPLAGVLPGGPPPFDGTPRPGALDAPSVPPPVDVTIPAPVVPIDRPPVGLPVDLPPPPPPLPPPPPQCAPGTARCLGVCIPLASDPLNCGACGKVCPSNICAAGECLGATPGDVVLVGHDFASVSAGSAQSRVLVNALSIPTTNPIRLLSYEEGVAGDRLAAARAVAAEVAGRTVDFTVATDAAALESPTLAASFDVVLVYGVAAADPVALGLRWQSALTTFTRKGGVVVVLDDGASPVPAMMTSSGLLPASGHTVLPATTHLLVSAQADVVGSQVLSPYASFGSPVSFQGVAPEGPDLVWVVREKVGAAPGAPTVVHRLVR